MKENRNLSFRKSKNSNSVESFIRERDEIVLYDVKMAAVGVREHV